MYHEILSTILYFDYTDFDAKKIIVVLNIEKLFTINVKEELEKKMEKNIICLWTDTFIERFVSEFDVETLISFNYKKNGSNDEFIKSSVKNWVDNKLTSDSYYEIVEGYEHMENLPPIDMEILNRMSKFEDDIYRMITRSTYKKENFYVLRQIYLNQLRYWNYVIQKYDINLFASFLPHNVTTYIPYMLCNELGIRTISFEPVLILDNQYFIIRKNNEPFSCILNRVILPNKEKIDQDFNDSDFYSYYRRYVLNEGDTSQDCTKRFSQLKYYIGSRTKGLKVVLKSKRLRLILFKGVEIVKCRLAFYKNRNKVKKKYCCPKKNEKFFLFALHYQPEATTLPLGGRYVDQFLAIEVLSKSLPKGINLYVKDHPNQVSDYGREAGFYENLLKLDNVKFVNPKDKSSDYLETAMAVASVTGTILLESSCKKKPGIMFGEFIYSVAPGIVQAKNSNEVKEAVKSIINGDIKITDDDLKAFFYKLSKVCIKKEDDSEVVGIIKRFFEN